ncbi:MAG: Hsp20/alpha crystallin family protein [Lachnospiraceae bacterium]|nr:Hsp20/alpha crystallin family protein [Lachnospiraceae bacterium]
MLMPGIFGTRDFDNFMDFTFPSVDKELYGKHAAQMMKTDVREVGDNYEVDVDLPGFKKDEIDIRLDKGTLTIAAAKGLDKEEDDKNGKFLRRERYTGAMSRSFYIGEGFTVKDIKAKYENGILSLTVPKKAQPQVEEVQKVAIEG